MQPATVDDAHLQTALIWPWLRPWQQRKGRYCAGHAAGIAGATGGQL